MPLGGWNKSTAVASLLHFIFELTTRTSVFLANPGQLLPLGFVSYWLEVSEPLGNIGTGFWWARCPCHPTSSVEALKTKHWLQLVVCTHLDVIQHWTPDVWGIARLTLALQGQFYPCVGPGVIHSLPYPFTSSLPRLYYLLLFLFPFLIWFIYFLAFSFLPILPE